MDAGCGVAARFSRGNQRRCWLGLAALGGSETMRGGASEARCTVVIVGRLDCDHGSWWFVALGGASSCLPDMVLSTTWSFVLRLMILLRSMAKLMACVT